MTTRLRRRGAVALGAVVGSAGVLLAGAAPAWAPTGNSWYSKANPPTSAEQCKDGGWSAYTDGLGYGFANQGACVSYVAIQGPRDHH